MAAAADSCFDAGSDGSYRKESADLEKMVNGKFIAKTALLSKIAELVAEFAYEDFHREEAET